MNALTLSFRILDHGACGFSAQLINTSGTLMIGDPTGHFPTPGAAAAALAPQVDALLARRAARSARNGD